MQTELYTQKMPPEPIEREIFTEEEIQCAVDVVLMLYELNKDYEAKHKLNGEMAA